MTCSIDGCGNPIGKRGWCNSHYLRWRRHGDPNAGRASRRSVDEFIEAAARYDGAECLIWPFGQMAAGYGCATYRGRRSTAHRIVLELATSRRPGARMEAAHEPLICHNRLCVNPRHLRWATPRDNQADRRVDRTDNRGERHGMSRLTSHAVLAIVHDNRPQAEIARDHGIAQPTVSDIKRGRRWSWLTGVGT